MEALDTSPELVCAGTMLLLRAMKCPESGQRLLSDRRIHMLRSSRYPWYPELRLLYWFDDETVTFLHIARCDEPVN
jgi:hypothetical protein